jgi:hypothetical protein
MWGLWWTKWHWGRFFSELSVFPCQFHSTGAPLLVKLGKKTAHLHLHHRVVQKALRLWCVRSICCGALHHVKKKVCTYVVYMRQYDWEITVFLVQLISEETNFKVVSSCWVKLSHLLGDKLAHCANLPRGQQCSLLDATCYFRHFNFVLEI